MHKLIVLKTILKFTLKFTLKQPQHNLKLTALTHLIAPTCFGAVTPSSGSALFELAKVTVVKITN
jgi:hypothetical protein